ncbi:MULTISPECIES: DUF2301 domain-containing membrane protein [Aphanizomenonaceae]|uniref:DUF2301 domain-containing membrane protein n=1 Tax=Dolichospermum heterosporum TAC447 TaxID=747523 RepID=A0ABY5LY75_9CYAN|nr:MULTISPECIES: DUF2301 domain-containing membrane protein [Aphanizomenonaceae]MDK2409672.1 DUF2301 domain-containing membrane protein [Aphanizomenon sp. 202]MDK2458973.1 DUF2301 domain-containing membrane protein [Aphanizomenon sp. PH219]MBE9258219.1 DUF2301 domain-containing membrane protein [Dolichospermum sp. LEGE 00246]MTJ32211.1 hypothetical protein [Aphanizomenon sp. UHCC 0183]UUO15600.1 DUF2301 domain-containing membrane protein [Dolichospermum heterosporum TAC447]
MTTQTISSLAVYQGQFGEFTITQSDRQSVIIYRTGLMIAALCFAIGSGLVLFYPQPAAIASLTPLYTCFNIALGVSLLTIHIYMAFLHRILQLFWIIGSICAFIFGHGDSQAFAITIYNQPLTILGIGFTFAALTGIFFKEGFCFHRLETKILTPLVPLLLLGHLTGILSTPAEQVLLATWAILFLIFAIRKVIQAIPPDIGDKSVFDYLKNQIKTRRLEVTATQTKSASAD